MTDNLLSAAVWECVAVAPGAQEPFGDLTGGAVGVIPGLVPGTAAQARRAAGLDDGGRDFDDDDWWYRARFEIPDSETDLELRFLGLATIADVWLNGHHLLHSENMFLPQTVAVADQILAPGTENELLLRFSSLNVALAARRPRPRWKVRRLKSQNMRWFRTTMLGRLIGWPGVPAAVGPWRPIVLRKAIREPVWHHLHTGFEDGAGWIDVGFSATALTATLQVGQREFLLDRSVDSTDTAGGQTSFRGRFVVRDVQPWWPHTHGDQPLYPVSVVLDGARHHRGEVGFRTVSVDQANSGFQILVNGVPVFCRGAYWTPLHPVSLGEDPTALRVALQQVRRGSMNMLRIGGETVYPGADMLALCDELGVMIWQDAMFAFTDVPDEPGLQESIAAELRWQLSVLAGHPSVVMISGGSEIDQQAFFFGIELADLKVPAHRRHLSAMVREITGLDSVTSTPTGGLVPTDPRSGVAHYYGVGAYLRPLHDAGTAGVRFAAECLAFANPPERVFVDEAFSGAEAAGHHPDWKAAVYRDAGVSWDFEDVLQHYVDELFGRQVPALRFTDPERALDLARATSAELFTSVLTQWRRPGSVCAGALVFQHHDAVPGAGLGLVDAAGRPKSAWYALARVMAPVAVLVTDEGMGGLDAHLVNDTGARVVGVVRVALFADGERCIEVVEQPITLPPHQQLTLRLNEMFDSFRDLNQAHHFGPAAHDVVVVTLLDHTLLDHPLLDHTLLDHPLLVQTPRGDAQIISQVSYRSEPARLEPDVGLAAAVTRGPDGRWSLEVTTRRFAQWVSVDCAGHLPADSWFHLPPGGRRQIDLGLGPVPRGVVRALNSVVVGRIDVTHRDGGDRGSEEG